MVAVNSVLLSAYLSAVAVNSVCRVSMVTLVCFSSSLLLVALVYMFTCTYMYIRKYSSTGPVFLSLTIERVLLSCCV